MTRPPAARDAGGGGGGKVTRKLVLFTALEPIDRDGVGARARPQGTGRIMQMPDDRFSARLGQGSTASPLRCTEIFRTERGWERCHLDEHNPGIRHHVRDRSWLSSENTPRLRLGQPCGPACTWPDLVVPYRKGTGQVKT